MQQIDRLDLKAAGEEIYVTSAHIYRVLVQVAKAAPPGISDHLYVAAKAVEVLSERGAQVVDIANQAH